MPSGSMGNGLDEHGHAGSAEGARCLTRRVAGEPKAMDTPPWDDDEALGMRT
jgi:hypothetical protein